MESTFSRAELVSFLLALTLSGRGGQRSDMLWHLGARRCTPGPQAVAYGRAPAARRCGYRASLGYPAGLGAIASNGTTLGPSASPASRCATVRSVIIHEAVNTRWSGRVAVQSGWITYRAQRLPRNLRADAERSDPLPTATRISSGILFIGKCEQGDAAAPAVRNEAPPADILCSPGFTSRYRLAELIHETRLRES